MPWDIIVDQERFAAILKENTYLSMFTDWTNPEMSSVWVGKRLDTWTPDTMQQSFTQACA